MSGAEHSDPELAVEVRSARRDLELAVEVSAHWEKEEEEGGRKEEAGWHKSNNPHPTSGEKKWRLILISF